MATGLVAAVAGVCGAVVGSFLNVVIHRVPRKTSLVAPGSACPVCETPIRPRDNIPVLSYLWLRGRCRTCAAPISPRYPLVELLTAGLVAGFFLRLERLELAAFASAASAVLVALAFIDLEHRRVPNVIVVPSTGAALVWVAGAVAAGGDAGPLVSSILAGAGAFMLFLVLAIVSGGIGFGDVKLAAFIGVVTGRFGWEVTTLAIFSGFVAGGLVALVLLVSGRSGRKDAIPFAPMLCLGAVVALYAGSGPVEAWLGV